MLTTMIAAALAAAAPAAQPADPHAAHGAGAHHAAGHDQHQVDGHEGDCKMDCCKGKADGGKGKSCAKHDEHADHQAKPKS